jgi:septal ring factor EnvC (AmiA/AmiB activator)
MVEHERSPEETRLPEPDPVEGSPASGLPSLLALLADTREQLDQTRAALAHAEQRAERATAESGALRAEIERTAADLVDAESRVVESHRQWVEATAREQDALAELADIRSSRSWRVTAPIRAVTGIRKYRGGTEH